jgi:hypothetical protein
MARRRSETHAFGSAIFSDGVTSVLAIIVAREIDKMTHDECRPLAGSHCEHDADGLLRDGLPEVPSTLAGEGHDACGCRPCRGNP